MFIEFEETPNPNTLKFLPGQEVLSKGTMDFTSIDDAAVSPLAKNLFSVGDVKGVFLGRDFVSVSKSDESDWEYLKPQILALLMDFFSSGQPVVTAGAETPDKPEQFDSELERQIVELLEMRVKPAVAADGGNIEFVEFDDGVVYLRMEGACAGCPSSTATLKMGIENLLKHYIPEVARVEPVQ